MCACAPYISLSCYLISEGVLDVHRTCACEINTSTCFDSGDVAVRGAYIMQKGEGSRNVGICGPEMGMSQKSLGKT
jgi:hypothetical protein